MYKNLRVKSDNDLISVSLKEMRNVGGGFAAILYDSDWWLVFRFPALRMMMHGIGMAAKSVDEAGKSC